MTITGKMVGLRNHHVCNQNNLASESQTIHVFPLMCAISKGEEETGSGKWKEF